MTGSDLRGNDVIDSRDVIARIEELEGEGMVECDVCDGSGNTAVSDDDDTDDKCSACNGTGEVSALDESDTEELACLKSLAEDADGYSEDWKYGATLIRDDHFEDYARELAEDIGAIDSNAAWPLMYIDWERAADALKSDYTSVSFDGVDYWVR